MQNEDTINFTYKDTIFRKLFSDKENLLSLYNALNKKKQYTNADDLTIETLENAIYMEMKNDIAFMVGSDIHLYEHQSTENPNMVLRFLLYIAAEYQRLTDKKSLYSRKLIKIPKPHFVVFYNGTEEAAEREQMKLSDAFTQDDGTLTLELCADMYNINAGRNEEILNVCESLKGYAEFIKRIRENQKTMTPAQAVKKAIDDCIKDGILADFLRKNRKEVLTMSIFEFDREEHERIIRKEEFEDGWAKGKGEGIAEGKTKGRFEVFYELVKDNLISPGIAAKKAGQSEDEFKSGMEKYFAGAR